MSNGCVENCQKVILVAARRSSSNWKQKIAMESSQMQHYMQDAKKQFKVYQRIGGCSTFDTYKDTLKLFYYHTINSHCGGITPELFNGASQPTM